MLSSFCTRNFRALKTISLIHSRSILSQSYYCNDLWNKRLSHDSFKAISGRDLGLKILSSITSNEVVSPLDYDIFVNKLHELDVTALNFIETVITKYSRTQSAVKTNESSSHAIVRAFIEFQKVDKLLDLLQHRAETGVFLDFVSANMLADQFIIHEDHTSAISVIWELCLQEYFSSADVDPLTFSLALFSASKLIESGLNEDTPSSETQDESDEVEYKFVKYVRNPNYDNFFDITRPRLKLGYTLLHLCNTIEKRPDSFASLDSVRSVLGKSKSALIPCLRLFGLSFAEQAAALTLELKKFKDPCSLNSAGLSARVLNRLIQPTESMISRPDDTPAPKGEPVQPTVSEVGAAVNEMKNLLQLAGNQTEDFFTLCNRFIHDGVLNNSECMDKEVENVRELYKQFEEARAKTWQENLSAAVHEETILKTKESLRKLLDEEENLTYFKKLDEIERYAWLAPRTMEERKWSRLKEWRRDVAKLKEKQSSVHDVRRT